MQQIDKVIRIPMDSELYFDKIEIALGFNCSEVWFDLDNIIELEHIRTFIINYDVDILT